MFVNTTSAKYYSYIYKTSAALIETYLSTKNKQSDCNLVRNVTVLPAEYDAA